MENFSFEDRLWPYCNQHHHGDLGFVCLANTHPQYPILTPSRKLPLPLPGANALNVEQAVATPIEQKVNGVEKHRTLNPSTLLMGFVPSK